MALHPALKRRTQAEIDSTTRGTPRAANVYRFPYLLTVLKEVMRYAFVADLGEPTQTLMIRSGINQFALTALPHQVTQEDTYAGYRIPAGSTGIPNVRAILHDPELYPDPFVFNPDGFIDAPSSLLDSNSKSSTRPGRPDPNKYVWGFGRRTCPGTNAESV